MLHHQFSIMLTEPASFGELAQILGDMYNFLGEQETLLTIDVVASQGYSILLHVGVEDVPYEDVRLKVVESFGKTPRPASDFMLV